jgi:hypothetical protein
MSYHDKLDIKLNNLQKEFFREFRKTFPDLADKIEIEKAIIRPDNFCFSVKSVSDVFGKLSFDTDDTEITVFSEFDHRHFPTYDYDEEKNDQRRIQLTCATALDYIKDFVNGNIIIEYTQQGDKILKSFEYHKDNPESPFSATITLKDEPIKLSLLSRLKNIFRQPDRQPIVTKKVNWFGDVA